MVGPGGVCLTRYPSRVGYSLCNDWVVWSTFLNGLVSWWVIVVATYRTYLKEVGTGRVILPDDPLPS